MRAGGSELYVWSLIFIENNFEQVLDRVFSKTHFIFCRINVKYGFQLPEHVTLT
jgi:hypothetical protein